MRKSVTKLRKRLKKTFGNFNRDGGAVTVFVVHTMDYQTGCNLLKSLGSTLIMMVIKLDIKGKEIIKLNILSSSLANQLDNGDYQGQVPIIIRKYGQFDIPLLVYDKNHVQNIREVGIVKAGLVGREYTNGIVQDDVIL
jgi:hypothetical protein